MRRARAEVALSQGARPGPFDFAVVSVAAALHIAGDEVREARLAAGGVRTTPWRLSGSEQALVGARPTDLGDPGVAAAAARATDGARPLGGNRFKLELLRRCVRRVLTELIERIGHEEVA